MKLYELVSEEQKLNELFLTAIDEETGEIKDNETLEELETELKNALVNKSEGIIKVIRNQESDLEMVTAEIERLTNLKNKIKKEIENFKSYIKFNMKKMDIKKIETSLGTISLRVNPPSTDVFDKDLIPKEFMREKIERTYEPKKDDIKKALQNGEEVPGARLIYKENLKIK